MPASPRISDEDACASEPPAPPGGGRLARTGRVTWALTTFVVVEATGCAAALVPFVLMAATLFTTLPGGWMRWTAAAFVAVPSYALFAVLLMICSAGANRLLHWRTPPQLDVPLADLGWPLLTWVRYVAAMRVVNVVAGGLFSGSPLWTMYLRLNGAAIGRRTYVNSTSVSDHNLLAFADDVVIGADAHISGHTIEHGRLRTGTVRIDRGVTVGLGSIIDIDVEIGAGCVVGAMSLVPKHSRLDAGAVYVGIPARKLNG